MGHSLLVLLFFMCLGIPSAWGVQASSLIIETHQPDGTKIEFLRKGDEKCNWIETPDGYSLIKNRENGYWEYAEEKIQVIGLLPSGIVVKAGEKAPPQIREKNLLKIPGTEITPEIVAQPDKSTIVLLWRESRGLRWRITKEGFPVVQNYQTGYWEYATWYPLTVLIPSGIIYDPAIAPPQDWGKHKKPSGCR